MEENQGNHPDDPAELRHGLKNHAREPAVQHNILSEEQHAQQRRHCVARRPPLRQAVRYGIRALAAVLPVLEHVHVAQERART